MPAHSNIILSFSSYDYSVIRELQQYYERASVIVMRGLAAGSFSDL